MTTVESAGTGPRANVPGFVQALGRLWHRLGIAAKLFMIPVLVLFVTGAVHELVSGGPVDSYSAVPKVTAPPGAPSYCVGDLPTGGNIYVQALAQRDCPQYHSMRVGLYEAQHAYTSAGEPVPPGMAFPWCKVLGEDPCTPTQDITRPIRP